MKIFNFALLLEYLQAGFYRAALSNLKLHGELREFVEVVGGHEQAHVEYLRKALGRHARPRPAFELEHALRNERRFVTTALVLEDLGVRAYNGQAANLTKKALAAAIKIVSVEGRHAAWIRDLAGEPPAPRAADAGATLPEIIAALRRLKIL